MSVTKQEITIPTILAHVKGSEFLEKISHQFQVSPERLYTVTIEINKEKKPRRLMELFDVGIGAFENSVEIDTFIRKERDRIV